MQWLINLILSLFQKPKSVETVPPKKDPEVPTKEEINSFPNKRIAILVGHGAGDSGAICFNGIEEHNYNKEVAMIISSKIPVKLFYKSKNGWAPTYLQIATYNPEICIELHLNSYNGKAFGCEVLCTSKKAEDLANSFAASFCAKFGRKNRGIKWLESGDRGFGNVKSASLISKKAILVEAFFCDNKSEWIEPLVYADWLIGWLNDVRK